MEIIALTPKAQAQAKTTLEREVASKPEKKFTGLRVAVIGGGCSGLQYQLGFDAPSEADVIHQYSNGLKVFVDEKSALYLQDAGLEFHDDIDRSGFEVTNPNATSTCGCGQSFS